MAFTELIQVIRGVRANLTSLASSGKAGVMIWTTDTNEIYVDSGTGSGIGTAWLRLANDIQVQVAATQTARLALTANIGDIALETDNSTTYILTASTPMGSSENPLVVEVIPSAVRGTQPVLPKPILNIIVIQTIQFLVLIT